MSVKSFEKFIITVTKKSGNYANGSPTKTPYGVPKLTRIWNHADQLELVLWDRDSTDESEVNLLEIGRGDTVSLSIEGSVAFFGEVLNRENFSESGVRTLEIFASDFLRLGGIVQRNRVIYNGLLPRRFGLISDTFTSTIQGSIRPMQLVETYNPWGVYEMNHTCNYGNDRGEISNVSGGDERKVSILFRPIHTTITGLRLYIFDPEENATVGNPAPSFSAVVDDLKIDINRVAQNSGSGRDEPTGANATLRDGSNATFLLGLGQKEGWDNATSGVHTTTDPGGQMSWTLNPSSLGGTSQVEVLTTGGSARDDGAGNLAGCVITTDGTNPAGIRSIDIASDTGASNSFRAAHRFSISTTSSSFNGAFSIYVSDASGSNEKKAAEVLVTGGQFRLVHNGNAGQAFETYAADTSHSIYFRLRPNELTFDFWEHTAAENDNLVGINFEFIDKDNFDFIPTKISKFEVNNTGAVGDINLGWVNHNEVTGRIGGGVAAFAFINFEDNPLDVNIDQWHSIVVSQPTATTTRDKIYLGGVDKITRRIRLDNFTSMRFDPSNVPGEEWENQPDIDYGCIIDYADPFTWVPKQENKDYVVDYEGKTIDWIGGQSQSTNTLRSSVFIDPISANALDFLTVRTTEYSNPSTGGLVESTRTMRVTDVVEELNLQVDTNAFTGGWHTTPIIATAFDSIVKNTFIIPQRSISEALRDLANQHEAYFFLSADSDKKLNFEESRLISTPPPTNNPTNNNPSTNEFVISKRTTDPDDMQIIEGKVNIKLNDEDIFTRFTVKGKSEEDFARVILWDLEDTIGHPIESVDVFSKEEDRDNLFLYAQLKSELHGENLKTGEVVVHGYFPTTSGRLAVNSIIRIIDPDIENGDDVTGTNNVFKVQKLVYDGENDLTTIFVTNTTINRDILEDALEAQRNVINGVDPIDPSKIIDVLIDGRVDTLSADTAFMALFDENDNEIETPGYQRQLCHVYTGLSGFRTYSAFFRQGIGTIPHDRVPIREMKLFDQKDPSGATLLTTTHEGTLIPIREQIFKWSYVGLQVTYTSAA